MSFKRNGAYLQALRGSWIILFIVIVAECVLLMINPRAFVNPEIQLLIMLFLFAFWLVQGIIGCFVHRNHEKKMLEQIDRLLKEIQIPGNAD